jgi:hypothetical protein
MPSSSKIIAILNDYFLIYMTIIDNPGANEMGDKPF